MAQTDSLEPRALEGAELAERLEQINQLKRNLGKALKKAGLPVAEIKTHVSEYFVTNPGIAIEFSRILTEKEAFSLMSLPQDVDGVEITSYRQGDLPPPRGPKLYAKMEAIDVAKVKLRDKFLKTALPVQTISTLFSHESLWPVIAVQLSREPTEPEKKQLTEPSLKNDGINVQYFVRDRRIRL